MHILLEAMSLLPDKSGLLFVYGGFGLVGGIAAGCLRYLSPFPSLTELAMRSIVGGAVGLVTGAACLGKFGADDTAIWWTMAVCGGFGFAGPTTAWELWKRFTGVGKSGNP